MSKTLKRLSVTVLFMAVAAVVTADSHEPPIYIWINFVKAMPGQGEALVGQMMQEDAKNFDPLVESGAALEWGIAMPVVHDGDDPATHVQWITFAGWDGVDKFMSSFMASRQAVSPDELKAMDEKWDTMVVPGSHSDMINRSILLGKGELGGASYIHLAYFSAKPGKAGAAKDAFAEFAAPVYDQLVADGEILNYGLHVPAVHRNQEWTHMAWYMSKALAARDAVGSAFDAAEASRSEDEAKAWASRMMETFEREHEDQILMVIHHKTAAQ